VSGFFGKKASTPGVITRDYRNSDPHIMTERRYFNLARTVVVLYCVCPCRGQIQMS
jgi:hypothetical protein